MRSIGLHATYCAQAWGRTIIKGMLPDGQNVACFAGKPRRLVQGKECGATLSSQWIGRVCKACHVRQRCGLKLKILHVQQQPRGCARFTDGRPAGGTWLWQLTPPNPLRLCSGRSQRLTPCQGACCRPTKTPASKSLLPLHSAPPLCASVVLTCPCPQNCTVVTGGSSRSAGCRFMASIHRYGDAARM